MIVGITETQIGMTKMQYTVIPEILTRLRMHAIRHGVCVGVDEQVHRLVRSKFITAAIHGLPGPDGLKRAKIDPTEFTSLGEPKPYLVRNKDIVLGAEALVACPKEPQDVLRSGTWSTVRYAVKIGILVVVIRPDGTYEVFF